MNNFKIGDFVYIPSVGVNAYKVVGLGDNLIEIENNDQIQPVRFTDIRNIWIANESNRVLLGKLFGEQFQKPLTTSEVLWDMFSTGNQLVPVVWKDDVEDDEFELNKAKWDYQLVNRYEFMLDGYGEEVSDFEQLDVRTINDYDEHWLVCNLETGLPIYKFA